MRSYWRGRLLKSIHWRKKSRRRTSSWDSAFRSRMKSHYHYRKHCIRRSPRYFTWRIRSRILRRSYLPRRHSLKGYRWKLKRLKPCWSKRKPGRRNRPSCINSCWLKLKRRNRTCLSCQASFTISNLDLPARRLSSAPNWRNWTRSGSKSTIRYRQSISNDLSSSRRNATTSRMWSMRRNTRYLLSSQIRETTHRNSRLWRKPWNTKLKSWRRIDCSCSPSKPWKYKRSMMRWNGSMKSPGRRSQNSGGSPTNSK